MLQFAASRGIAFKLHVLGLNISIGVMLVQQLLVVLDDLNHLLSPTGNASSTFVRQFVSDTKYLNHVMVNIYELYSSKTEAMQ